ncbi:MAG: DUF58 domain-containing protein [Lachnospiraceae bacterium]|nr:DUF58 domain-containing protein [Lachnospiraceae bacterium]
MRGRRAVYGAAVVLLLALCVYSNHPAALALLVTVILLPVWSGCLLLPCRNKVSVLVEAKPMNLQENEADPGKSGVSLTVKVSNASHLPVYRAGIRLTVTNTLTGETTDTQLSTFVGNRKTQILSVICRSEFCGTYRAAVESIDLYDVLGVTRLRAGGAGSCEFLLLPDFFPIRIIVEQNVAEPAAWEYAQDAAGGDRAEVFSLREYRQGDPAAAIHWKASSKLDRLIIKEGSKPIERRILLIWDPVVSGHEEKLTPEELHALAGVYVSVAQSLADQGTDPEAAWYDGSEGQWESSVLKNTESLLAVLPRILDSSEGREAAVTGTQRWQEKRHILKVGVGYDETLAELLPDAEIAQLMLLRGGDAPGKEGRQDGGREKVYGFHVDDKEQVLWELYV